MQSLQTADLERERPSGTGARSLLTRRLADIVCLPSSQVTPQERWMVADVLEELLRTAEPNLRAKVASRLASQAEAPAGLLRRLAMDAFDIAQPIVEQSLALTDFDMMEIARKGDQSHRLALARRETVSETVAASLCASADPSVLTALLRNEGAQLAPQTIDFLIQISSRDVALSRRLVRRSELRPAQAFRLFWDCDHAIRRTILERFAVGRAILQDAAGDVMPLAMSADRQDDAVMRALGYIERRQRNRPANDQSQWGGLEGVFETASKEGLGESAREEAALISNIEPTLLGRIVDDFGGEPLGVFSKATGLKRPFLHYALRSAGHELDSAPARQSELIYDILSVDKAQTVLRYWDWSVRRAKGQS